MATISKLPSGKYQAKIRRIGFRTLSNIFMDRRSAQAWARKTESEVERSVYLDTSQAQSLQLSEVLDRYSKEIDVKIAKKMIKHLCDGVLPKRLWEFYTKGDALAELFEQSRKIYSWGAQMAIRDKTAIDAGELPDHLRQVLLPESTADSQEHLSTQRSKFFVDP